MRRGTLDETAFDKVTEESAYWIGFLLADGCVHKNILHLTLRTKDINHLFKFRTFLKATNIISSHVKSSTSSFHITSDKIINILANYGMVSRKSHNAQVIGLEYNKHFWRGVIDGDGCLGTYKRTTHKGKYTHSTIVLDLSRSYNLLNQFQIFTHKLFPNFKASINAHGSIWSIKLCCTIAVPMIKILYHNANIYLDRKYAKAMQILKDYDML